MNTEFQFSGGSHSLTLEVPMSRRELIQSIEDCEWLTETHLSRYHGPHIGFGSAVLKGNEDCPEAIELYVSSEPLVTDGCVTLIYNAETDEYVRK